MTVTPWPTVWFVPALAVGASRALVVMVTVDGVLSTWPSFTINCATYVPGASTVNVGVGSVRLLSTALLPGARVVRLQ